MEPPQPPDLEPNQRQLLELLRAQGIAGRSVLEVGCGKGRLHRRLLDEGATSVVGVDFIRSWLAEAERLARERGHGERVTYVAGDFLQLAERLEPADLILLDKVVHCYQEPERLVRRSAQLTRSLYALSSPCLLYTSPSPRDGLLSRMPSSA